MDYAGDRESSEERFRKLAASASGREGSEERLRQTASGSPSSQRFVGGVSEQQSSTSHYDPRRSTPLGEIGAFDSGRSFPDPSGGGGRGFVGPIDPSPPSWYSRPLGAQVTFFNTNDTNSLELACNMNFKQ